jgi:heptosyltransferase I
MMRILIVKTSSMGDVIHNLPIVTDIYNHFPNAEIDWVVEEGFADIVALHPNVSRVIPIAFRRWKRNLLSRNTINEITDTVKNLRNKQYDYILDTQGLLKSVLICLCARGPRFGRDWQSNREAFASLFYQHRFRVEFNQHAVNRGRQLTAMVLKYPLPTSPPDYGLSTESLTANIDASLRLPKSYVMCLHATSRDSKLWPVENWIKLGKALAKQELTFVLPWGNVIEFERAQAISASLADSAILPKLKLKSLAEVTAGAKAAIGVDTGLIHLAVALNVPSIAIYTDSDPILNGAYASKSCVAINIGGQSITPSVDEVLQAFSTLNMTNQ